jgi:uncharacterized protein (DUF1499 family)
VPGGLIRWLAAALILAGAAGYSVIRFSADDPARWHVDPARVQPGDRSNDFLAAPAGTTKVPADLESRLYPESPRALLARFDDMAGSQPRVRVVAGDPDSLMITYVQRSRYIGFPDYLTVRAVAFEGEVGEDGVRKTMSGLIIYSRSRYGRSDFGVNRARVELWLAALDR